MYVYFFIYKSCVCPGVVTARGGAAALTSSCIAASKQICESICGEGAEHGQWQPQSQTCISFKSSSSS